MMKIPAAVGTILVTSIIVAASVAGASIIINNVLNFNEKSQASSIFFENNTSLSQNITTIGNHGSYANVTFFRYYNSIEASVDVPVNMTDFLSLNTSSGYNVTAHAVLVSSSGMENVTFLDLVMNSTGNGSQVQFEYSGGSYFNYTNDVSFNSTNGTYFSLYYTPNTSSAAVFVNTHMQFNVDISVRNSSGAQVLFTEYSMSINITTMLS